MDQGQKMAVNFLYHA